MAYTLGVIAMVLCGVAAVFGHGMMLDPPARNSLWRFDSSAPINYDDNALFCGGYQVQWEVNHGLCGMCGDDYRHDQPRPNENGGEFGQGKVVANYTQGGVVNASIRITANHLGHFVFSVCKLDDPKTVETEACFQSMVTSDGDVNWKVPSPETGMYYVEFHLPDDMVCDRCVLRWTYVAGNNWGVCTDGKGKVGCGPQESFVNCADVAIYAK